MGKTSAWQRVATTVSQAAPLLGGLIGGPVGSAAGTAIKLVAGALGADESPEAIEAAIMADSDAAIKLRELELQHKTELESLTLAAETSRIQAINQTMQAEARSEHWPQYSWRPAWGFVSAAAFLAVCVAVCVMCYQAITTGDGKARPQKPAQRAGVMAFLYPQTITPETHVKKNLLVAVMPPNHRPLDPASNFEGKSYKEIAFQLSNQHRQLLSPQVRRQLHSAKRAIREHFSYR